MLIGIFIGASVALLFAGLIAYWLKQQQIQSVQLFENNAKQALGTMMQEIVRTTRAELQAEKHDISQTIAKDLKQQSDTFKDLTLSLRHEIDTRQREIRSLEEDRNKKYGELSQALTDYKALTHELRNSTEHLKKILANNQLRGNWGEIQAEKILEAAGMIAGTHYVKQRPIYDQSNLRPDFTVMLPNKMELYVDVKFPLQSLQQAMQTEDKNEQQRYMVQFGRDVKDRMREAQKYVQSNKNSVDYVILFVPSESVFEIINRQFVEIIDEGFSQKVILVSPHSFFAVVRTIFESYVNFHYEQNLKEILQYLQDLLNNFERFKIEFTDVGKAIALAHTKYKQIEDTRYSQINRAVDKVNKISLGTEATALAATSDATLIIDPLPQLSEEQELT